MDVFADVNSPAIVRYRDGFGAAGLAMWWDDRLFRLDTSLDHLLTLSRRELQRELGPQRVVRLGHELDLSALSVAAPIEAQEMWAAGVTYRRSREARIEEAVSKDIYTRVYEADRPELFFKSPGWRVVGPGDPVGIRGDSAWNVPEPELAVLSNAHGEIVAFACGNDMSSRSLEGENPLYLPQAKVYDRCCSLGPAAVLAWGWDASNLAISLTIERTGAVVFKGSASTAEMVRSLEGLVGTLHSVYSLPVGAWLLTGTSIVPESSFTLEAEDVVRMRINGLGELSNAVDVIVPRAVDARPRLGDGESPLTLSGS